MKHICNNSTDLRYLSVVASTSHLDMWYALDNRTLTSIYSKPEPVCINLSSHIIVAATWVFKEVYGITGEDDLSSFIIHKELESHPPTEGQPK